MLMRFDPFRDVDRLAQHLFGSGERQGHMAMPMDAYRQGEQIVVHFDLPGVDPSTVDLTVEKNVLVVKAERSWPQRADQEVIVAERPQGSFTRQLFLGEALDADRIEANYADGVLTVSIPVAERAKPRRVQIGGDAGQSRAIGATATEASDTSASQAVAADN